MKVLCRLVVYSIILILIRSVITYNAVLLTKTNHPKDGIIYTFYSREEGIIKVFSRVNEDSNHKLSIIRPLCDISILDLNNGKAYKFVQNVEIIPKETEIYNYNLPLVWGKILSHLLQESFVIEGLWDVFSNLQWKNQLEINEKLEDILSRMGYLDKNATKEKYDKLVYQNNCKNDTPNCEKRDKFTNNDISKFHHEKHKEYLYYCLELLSWEPTKFDNIV